MPLISVLTVAYNPKQEFKACLDSLCAISDNFELEIIVVDNHSNERFLHDIKADYPTIKFIHSEENLGFGGGNNLAFAHSSGDYILCVNPDLVMNAAALAHLMNTIEADSSIGIVAPKTTDSNGELVYTARADYTIARLSAKYLGLDRLLPTLVHGAYRQQMHSAITPFETEWLQGSCLLMRRDTYAAVQGFDDGFFLYLEDTDICRRVHQMGLKIVYVPQAIVSHVGGATTAKYPTLRVKSYHYSPIYYHRKQGHHGGVWLLKTIFAIELGIKVIMRSIVNLLRPDEARQKHIEAEIQTLRELGSY